MTEYVCARCGRSMPYLEGHISTVGPLCHPDDPNLPDCYSLTPISAWDILGILPGGKSTQQTIDEERK